MRQGSDMQVIHEEPKGSHLWTVTQDMKAAWRRMAVVYLITVGRLS